MNQRLLFGIFVGLLASACFRTTIYNGSPPARATIKHEEQWHHGFVAGMAELEPYNLGEECPKGWAELHTKTSFTNFLAEVVTAGVYNPQTVTIHCRAFTPKKPAVAPPTPANNEPAATPQLLPPASSVSTPEPPASTEPTAAPPSDSIPALSPVAPPADNPTPATGTAPQNPPPLAPASGAQPTPLGP